jgi:anti-sigma factor RsiW
MDCRESDRLIDRLLNGPLADSELAALETHAQACEACREKLESFQKMQTTLIQGLGAKTPGIEARDQVLSRLADSPMLAKDATFRQPVRLGLPKPIAAAVLLAIGACIGLGVARFRADAPQTTTTTAQSDHPPAGLERPTPIRVCDLSGTVLMKRHGASVWQELTASTSICVGDRFHASPGSSLGLALEDESTVRLKANSMLSLDAFDGQIEFGIDAGTVTANLKGPHGPFFITTPQGKIEALGTEFTVSVR